MMTTTPLRNEKWAVFISGRGSNLQAILDLGISKKIALVLSDKDSAEGLLKSKRFGLPTMTLQKPLDWNQIHTDLLSRGITKIFLLGFMRIIPGGFLNQWQGQIFNIHPSILPHYPGKDSFQRSFAEGADVGATLHHVIEEVDMGQKIFQKIAVHSTQIQNQSISVDKAQLALSFTEHRLVKEGFQCL